MNARVPPKRLFATDQNFPEPILDALATTLADFVELVPVRKIGSGLGAIDDWELLLALSRDERGWDGLITCDAALLAQPKEMVVLDQTKLTLVVTEAVGHNPVKAVGTLLCHLAHVCRFTVRERAQIWRLKVSQKQPDEVIKYLDDISSRRGVGIAEIYAVNRLTDEQLRNGA